jgi:hypothetical protein
VAGAPRTVRLFRTLRYLCLPSLFPADHMSVLQHDGAGHGVAGEKRDGVMSVLSGAAGGVTGYLLRR